MACQKARHFLRLSTYLYELPTIFTLQKRARYYHSQIDMEI